MYNQKQVSSYVSTVTGLMSRVLGRGQTQRLVDEHSDKLEADESGMVLPSALESFAEAFLANVGNSGKQASLRDELEEELEDL